MSTVDDAKKVLDVAGHGLRALETIGKLAKTYLESRPHPHEEVELGTAMNVLTTIMSLVDVVRASLDGKVSIAHVDEEIKKLSTSLADNDAAARSDLDAKFPPQD